MRTSFWGIVFLAIGLVLSVIMPSGPEWTLVEGVFVLMGGTLMLHELDRLYFLRQRRKPVLSVEALGYMSEHLISHMRESGMTDGQISRKIVETIMKKL